MKSRSQKKQTLPLVGAAESVFVIPSRLETAVGIISEKKLVKYFVKK